MILHGRLSITGAGQVFQVLRLPDFRGWVVQVHRVYFQSESVSADTALASLLAHDIGPGFTFQTNDPQNAWNQIFLRPEVGTGQGITVYTPVPYELVGPQRWVMINSAGNSIGRLSVVYGLRRESNLTLWSALRQKTSFRSSLTT